MPRNTAPSRPAREKYVPRHRSEPTRPALFGAPHKALRTTAVLSGVAVAATGVTVAGGVVAEPTSDTTLAADVSGLALAGPAHGAALTEQELAERAETVSRSDRREAADPLKSVSLTTEQGHAVTRSEDLDDADPRTIARALLPEFGFSADQFGCLDALYVSESNWRVDADNPTSSAYGIPQALTSMHDLPPDYHTSAEAQIRWGLGYIQDAYGTPCNAWAFKQGHNWY